MLVWLSSKLSRWLTVCLFGWVGLAHAQVQVEAFAGVKYDLKLDKTLSLNPSNNTGGNQNGVFSGISVSNHSNDFNLTLIAGATSYREPGIGTDSKDWVIKSLAVTLTPYATDRSALQITAGRVVIPFGIYETQRVFPSVILPRTTSDSLFGDVISRDVVSPFQNGLIGNFQTKNHGLTYAVYFPETISYNYQFEDFQRVRSDFVDIPGTNGSLSVPAITVDLRDPTRSTGRPNPRPVLSEQRMVSIERSTQFVSYQYEKGPSLVDVEYAITRLRGSTSTGQAFTGTEQYAYIGSQYTIGQYTLLIEGTGIQTRIANTPVVGTTNAGLSVTKDMDRILLVGNVSRTNGNIMNGGEFSFGGVYRVYKNLYVRLLYRNVEGRVNVRRLGETQNTCVSPSCYAVFDPAFITSGAQGQIDDGGNTGLVQTTETIPYKSRGVELRAIWYF